MKTIELYNGVKMPMIGFGPGGMGYVPNRLPPVISSSLPARAWRKFVSHPLMCKRYVDAIASAFKAGFRLLDYSAAYGNGRAIVKAIGKSGIRKEEIFLTGRITNTAQFKGADAVRSEITRIMDGYETDRLDLLMFHWPVTGHFEETWKVICEAYNSGKVRSIGVANCHAHHLEMLGRVGLKPMVNQFEVHPLFTQKDLIKFCQDQAIVVEAYTPIARFDDRLMRLPALKHIASKYGKTAVQIVLRWHIQNGVVPVIRSLNKSRQMENFDVFDFELTDEEIRIIDGFNIDSRLRYHPDNCDFTIL